MTAVAVILSGAAVAGVWLVFFRLDASAPAPAKTNTADTFTPSENQGTIPSETRNTAPAGDLNLLAASTDSGSSDAPLAEPPSVPANTPPKLPSPKEQLDAALAKANADLQANPRDVRAYIIRGNVYSHRKLWDQARSDYEAALQIDGSRADAKFNLAEIDFLQKNYAAARSGFLALENDPDQGDYVSYKVFLCDLFGGQDAMASKELDAFNQVASHPSYYFANVAWDLVHHQTEDARSYLASGMHIYNPQKLLRYGTALHYLGYLPLPPPPQVEDTTQAPPTESGQSIVPGATQPATNLSTTTSNSHP